MDESSTRSPVERPAPHVPDYELLRRIGRGGYGEVWLGRNVTGTYRAVKVVYRDQFDSDRPFEREFEGISKFEPISRHHSTHVDILHVGRQESYFYYVMELADDATLERRGDAVGLISSPAAYRPLTLKAELERCGRLTAARTAEIGLSLAVALGHLHAAGLVHRDVKPPNIIFVNGVPKLADIGLVTDARGNQTIVGTDGYLPPEGAGTPGADLYALGKVLFEVSTGIDRRRYPEAPDGLEHFADRKDLLQLDEIIARACAPAPANRYASAWQMEQELAAVCRGESIRRCRRVAAMRRLALPLAAIVVMAGVALAARGWQKKTTNVLRPNEVAAGLTAAEKAEGFRLLFDGRTLNGWFCGDDNWEVADGAVVRMRNGDHLIYQAEAVPEDFDLRFQWRVSPGTDSGVFYRPGMVEYQVVDNADAKLGSKADSRAGSLYMVMGPERDAARPFGEWNDARVVAHGTKIEHWLNGERVVAFDYAAPESKAMVDRVKAFELRRWGKSMGDFSGRGGALRLQDRTGRAEYRAFRWRRLPPPAPAVDRPTQSGQSG